MQVLTTIDELRTALDDARRDGATVGFVPTMGYLHAGHLSLMERSGGECDLTVVSIFVNPLQFAPTEDLASYPRDLDADLDRCHKSGAGVVFVPSNEEMYPEPPVVRVAVGEVAKPLEGVSRPEHFDGVATVVAKLFNLVGRCRAYFGEKDFQQLLVVTRLARDLSFPVDVVGCPTVREPDGLAMSSRNAYLSPDERAVAPRIYRALQTAAAAIGAGERDPAVVRGLLVDRLRAEPRFALDYADVVDARTLGPLERVEGEVRLLVAIGVGRARLIDNLGVTVETAPTE